MPIHTTKVLLLVMQIFECVADVFVGINMLFDITIITFQQRTLVHPISLSSRTGLRLVISTYMLCFPRIGTTHSQIGSVHCSAHLLKILEVLESEVRQVGAHLA